LPIIELRITGEDELPCMVILPAIKISLSSPKLISVPASTISISPLSTVYPSTKFIVPFQTVVDLEKDAKEVIGANITEENKSIETRKIARLNSGEYGASMNQRQCYSIYQWWTNESGDIL
jgi:hypothetical protein